MRYRCPVCGAEQADGVHLANHLAVTASLGRENHREWLEEYAPDWGDRGPEELAETVVEFAESIEADDDEGGGAGPTLEDDLARHARSPGRGDLTGDAESVFQEARELTRKRRENATASGDAANDEGDGDGDASASASASASAGSRGEDASREENG